LCAGELARVRLRLRNVGQKPMCNVWVTSNMAQCVWFGDERGSTKRFCAPVRVPGSRLMPGASHELHVWLRAPPGDVATGELSRLVMRLALAFYYEPANDPGQVPMSASASGASLAYRFQRVQTRIDVAPSLRLAYLCSARPHEIGSRLVRVSAHNKWRSGVFRISRITAHSPRWSLQLALDGDVVVDVNDAIVRPEETAHVLLKAVPVGSAEDKSFVSIDLSSSSSNNKITSVDATGGVVDPRAASDSDVWLQPVNDAALAAVRATAAACDYFHDADLRSAALRSALASGAPVTAGTIDSVPRRANWCDIVVHWELANVRGDAERFGQLSLCDVRLDRGPLFVGSDSSIEALRERRLSMSLLSEPTLPIEHVRFAIEAPTHVTHDFASGPCVRTVTAIVYNCHPTQPVTFVIQLLKPHEQMLADAATSRMRRRTRVATSLAGAASNALTPFRLAETGLRRAAQNCAARAAGPGSGGGGGVRAKGSCLFIGVQQRGPFTLAPREQRNVAMLALFPEPGVHNVARMRVVVDPHVLPADSQTLVIVEQQQQK
jgi:hypothetical protein